MQNLSHIVFGNYILTVSLFAWTVAQVSKTAIHAFLCGKFQAERLWGAGGMPSSHSALVCALAVSAAKSEGMASPIFALALVLALIVMYDATGVRRETGNQAKVLNLMLDEWVADEDEPLPGISGKKLKEKVGHTPAAGHCVGAGNPHVSRLPAQAFGPSLERRRFLAFIGKN